MVDNYLLPRCVRKFFETDATAANCEVHGLDRRHMRLNSLYRVYLTPKPTRFFAKADLFRVTYLTYLMSAKSTIPTKNLNSKLSYKTGIGRREFGELPTLKRFDLLK